VEAVADQLVGGDVIADETRIRGIDDQLADEAPQLTLGAHHLLVAVQ
jgi:hypothetical protein